MNMKTLLAAALLAVCAPVAAVAGAASWDRKDGQGFVLRHAAGFKFNNTEIDAL